MANRTLLKDFVIKIAAVFLAALLISLAVSYFYFKNRLRQAHLNALDRAVSMVVENELIRKSSYLEDVFRIEGKNLLRKDFSELKRFSGAQIAVVIENTGKFKNSIPEINVSTVESEPFFEYVREKKHSFTFFHALPQELFADSRDETGDRRKKVIIYSLFYPVMNQDGQYSFIWFGFILDRQSNLFENLSFFDVDGGFVWDGENILALSMKGVDRGAWDIDKERIYVTDPEKGYLRFRSGGKDFLGKQLYLSDFRKERIGMLVIARQEGMFDEIMKIYILPVLTIFFVASAVGIFFVFVYFKHIFAFFSRMLAVFDSVRMRNYDVRLEPTKDIYEYAEVSREFNDMLSLISRRLNLIEEEVNVKTIEILELTQAMRILDQQDDFDRLVDKSVDFLRNVMGLNVMDLNDCIANQTRCDDCRFKILSLSYEERSYGLCIEQQREGGSTFEREFFDLFEEVFRINFQRIAHLRRMQENFNEASFISDLLLSLLRKKNIHEIFSFILEKGREYCSGDASYIGVYDARAGMIALKFFLNVKTDEFKMLRFPSNTGFGGLIIRERKGLFSENYFDDPRITSPFMDTVRREGIVSVIAVPIFHDDDVFGILYVGYRKQRALSGREIPFLEKLSNAAALALEKETLLTESKKKEEELRGAYEEIVSKRREIHELLKSYKEANVELERYNRELNEQYEIVKRSFDELERLNKAKDVFLGILSHELKTPLTILKGYFETLLSDKFKHDAALRDILDACRRSVINLTQIVDDSLDYMRMEMRKLRLSKNPYPLRQMIQSLSDELDVFLRERGQMLDVTIDGDPVLGIDAKWFKRALFNLFINAVKFTPDNRYIRIYLSVVDQNAVKLPPHVTTRPSPARRYLMIAVSDEGVGIPEGELSRIFERFYELGDIKTHHTGKHKFMAKGMGLGLSFVKQIIELHGGVVFAESPGYDKDKFPGSKFTIYVPAEEPEKAATITPAKKTIVIIEGEQETSKFIEFVFARDYNVSCAVDGGNGILRILDLKPALVLINVNLPGRDGYDVCAAVKEDARIKDVPVVLYNTHTEIFDAERAKTAKADETFAPLFDIDSLFAVAKRYLEKE